MSEEIREGSRKCIFYVIALSYARHKSLSFRSDRFGLG